ncbi:MAG TPA: hypothetical protein VH575_27935 [Gemmataceae bacterium]|jgi:hypothetical protein
MLNTRLSPILGSVLVLVFLVPPIVRAEDEVDQRALDRAHNFLKGASRGRHILGFMHAGTKYAGHKYMETRLVTDGDGKRIPGRFALIYAFDWNNNDTTDVAFLCDRRGNVYQVQVLDTSAIINQPFVVADATIKILGNVLLEAFKGNMAAQDKKQIQKAIDDADAKGMLLMSLKLQQTFGK